MMKKMIVLGRGGEGDTEGWAAFFLTFREF